MIWLLVALAIAPGIGILMFVYFKDKYEKEPLSLIIKCFFWGMLTVIPPIIIETMGSSFSPDKTNNIYSIFLYSFAFVGFSEEFSKYLLLRIYPFRKKDFNEPFDGIVYAVAISMGFATFENIFYVIEGGIGTGLVRIFTAVPAHGAFAVIMGFYVGLAKFKQNHFGYLFIGVLMATLAHGAYDFFIMQNDYPALKLLTLVCLIIIIILSFRAMKIHRNNSPFKQ